MLLPVCCICTICQEHINWKLRKIKGKWSSYVAFLNQPSQNTTCLCTKALELNKGVAGPPCAHLKKWISFIWSKHIHIYGFKMQNDRKQFHTMSQYYTITEGIVQRLPFNITANLKLLVVGMSLFPAFSRQSSFWMYNYMEVKELCPTLTYLTVWVK